MEVLTRAGARVEVCTARDTILSVPHIKSLIGTEWCDGVIGQLTEVREGVGVKDRGERVGRVKNKTKNASLTPSFPFFFPHQDWGDDLFGALKAAGGKVYSNYAVG